MLQNHPTLPKAQVPKPTSQLPTPQKESRPQGISPSDGFHSKSGGYLLSHQNGSTIGADGLNFSVRNGKRWNTVTITTIMTEHDCTVNYTHVFYNLQLLSSSASTEWRTSLPTEIQYTKGHQCGKRPFHHNNCYYDTKSFGLLVVLGFDVAVFTPAPYLRHRL